MRVGRISRTDMLMEMAYVASRRGTCTRAQVGCVAAQDGRVLVTGYNGAPKNMPHCNHDCDCGYECPDDAPEVIKRSGHARSCTSETPCRIAVHAEANAIAFAAKFGVSLLRSELFSTHTPCLPCAQLIINSGVERLTCVEPYRDAAGMELLVNAGLEVVKYKWTDKVR